MNRYDRTLFMALMVMAQGLGLIACSAEEAREPAQNEGLSPVVQADVAPLPDFRHYVVGSLAQPDAASRDPFRERGEFASPTSKGGSAIRPKPRQVRFSLRGIVERDGHRVAVFRRGAVRVGESLAGWKVSEIGARAVTLERNGLRRRLSL
jgi:hypothetical protein